MQPPLSLYVHFPYCVRKCPYCDFASRASRQIPEQVYLTALGRELSLWRQELATDARPLHSIFLGGGTPSLFSPASIATLLGWIGEHWSLEEGCEITIEANPESLTLDKLAGYHQAGVNRLSLGVQSLLDERLKQLHRPHDVATAIRAMAWGRQAGFTNINLDLIYATPGQSLSDWQGELAMAIALQPDHLSCYTLTLEEGTPFFAAHEQGELPVLGEEEELLLFSHTRQWLTQQGMPPYEISNFCRPGFQCRHNLNYWNYGDYLGLGAAAHGKWTSQQGIIHRTVNIHHDQPYMASLMAGTGGRQSKEILTPREAGAETLIMGLRLHQGIHLAHYQRHAGISLWQAHGKTLEELLQDGLLQLAKEQLSLTENGVKLANLVLAKLV
ncbi:MAG: radical SAM family heme chaperone HemW [Magnetococcales bacterium]|nr:radical SAM family heme chaperone HemW [Magnetococcales bacterium]